LPFITCQAQSRDESAIRFVYAVWCVQDAIGGQKREKSAFQNKIPVFSSSIQTKVENFEADTQIKSTFALFFTSACFNQANCKSFFRILCRF
jgi:hypothetical protein